MAKDRAAPFSRKHRKYWIPVLGGMLLISFLNVFIGVCTYEKAGDVEPMRLSVPPRDAGTLNAGQIPVEVIRAFVDRYPRIAPAGADRAGDDWVVLFPPGAAKRRATFQSDGTFIADE